MGVLVAAGALSAVLAALSGPPLGGWKALGRTTHRRLDLAFAGLLALSPVAPGRTAVSILVAEAVAVVAWRLQGVTRYEARAAARPAGPPSTSPSAASSPSPPAGPAALGLARTAGRLVGRGRRASEPGLERLPAGARKAGYVAGRLARRRRTG
ncbi:MAG TPA: hypothetical protein VFA11_09090 [Acidimicrobiales bacterium]|nr:hypothetical protein [Acidimicrobiales bacterium]